ncbi:ATP-binding protein [Microbacterium fluvii]|uniref:histidine kinase n=1 Tax=Microbacterium fluvii TaxID=415215 RepID=A0ABW2HDK2_9MICO|nr:ATP-binding protein [Microbacterium fluvii]MCU4673049.1 ATP-binding protein [Microbacterium fluvii]
MAVGAGRSVASRLFIWLAVATFVFAIVTAGLLVLDSHRSVRAEAERVTQAVAETLAHSPTVRDALALDDRAATSVLQPVAEEVMGDARVDFVTIMDTSGIRITHRDVDEIGQRYIGTIPATIEALTEEFTGTLGPSLRTIVPVESTSGAALGWVSVGVTIDSVAAQLGPRLVVVVAIALALIAAGLAGAVVARRATRGLAGDLPAGTIRDTLASAESMRTLGEALRAQTHEHGNRMHTAVALLELGRTREAIEILTDSARQSQALVDQVAARTEGDPTVGALLLGKASQAIERGIRWETDIDPEAPRSVLTPTDAVALVGNLIDNALDAAATGAEPRWVRVRLAPTAQCELALVVSDSGPGVPVALRESIFERGFSTKPAGPEGRGVGLALAAAIVDDAGGSIRLDDGPPTTFRVVLPTPASTEVT